SLGWNRPPARRRCGPAPSSLRSGGCPPAPGYSVRPPRTTATAAPAADPGPACASRTAGSCATLQRQRQLLGDALPVERHHALVVMHGIQRTVREARAGLLHHPDAVGVGHGIALERANRLQR